MNIQQEIKKSILRQLRQCERYMLPQETLVANTVSTVVPPPLVAEITNVLRSMEVDELIVPGRDGLGNVKWKLTSAGSAICNELHL